MIHFRQDKLFEDYFEKNKFIEHTYKDKKLTISKENINSIPKEFVQSLATRLAKSNSSSSKMVPGKGNGDKKPVQFDMAPDGKDSEIGKNKGGKVKRAEDKVDNTIDKKEFVKKQVLRLSTTTHLFEDKLDYPKVFKALLTEPHNALDYRRKTEEDIIQSIFVIDPAIGYNNNDKGFHKTLITVCKEIKGVDVLELTSLTDYSSGEYYLNKLDQIMKKNKGNIYVFSQGCGGSPPDVPFDLKKVIGTRKLTFCTCFKHGETCGCDIIPSHERLQKVNKSMKIYYSIDSYNKLSLLE
jgi:hypothetical protein